MPWNIILLMFHLSLLRSRYLLVRLEGNDEGTRVDDAGDVEGSGGEVDFFPAMEYRKKGKL